mmetsp:Transcript_17429/g.56234  ORF Transcript_17429/g.56234 Transcript_17429/m.56234 type:complete len:239 (-) Transcript_17429:625-1341(-)
MSRRSGMRAARAVTASRTGMVARPLVSPWNEASRYGRPSVSSTCSTNRSPGATGTFLSKVFITSSVRSTSDASRKRSRRSSSSEFWSRDVSSVTGAATMYRPPSRFAALVRKEAAASCRKTASVVPYVCCRISRVRVSLCRLSASHISCRSCCHRPLGDTLFTMCTRMASKMAWLSVCSGRLIASSSALTAGYFARLIGLSIAAGRVLLSPSPVASWVANMNCFHSTHHLSPLPRSPS